MPMKMKARNSNELEAILEYVIDQGLFRLRREMKEEHDDILDAMVYTDSHAEPRVYQRRKRNYGLLSGFDVDTINDKNIIVRNIAQVNMDYKTNFRAGDYLEPLISMGASHPVGYYYKPSRFGYREYLEPRPFMDRLSYKVDKTLMDEAFYPFVYA